MTDPAYAIQGMIVQAKKIAEGNPRALKSIAIVEHVYAIAEAQTKNIKAAYPAKRIFRPIDRRPAKRIKKRQAKTRIALDSYFSAISSYRIISAPVPKYPNGRISEEIAMLDSYKYPLEIVENPGINDVINTPGTEYRVARVFPKWNDKL